MNWFITADCHRNFSRFRDFSRYNDKNEQYNIICLGDFCINYYNDVQDKNEKNHLKNEVPNITFYIVRGNHEKRPQHLEDIVLEYDDNVKGEVYIEPSYPNIKYFKDFGIYNIENHIIGVIGGAYSVDKFYRLQNGWRWFEDEQLSEDEMKNCKEFFINKNIDIMLTHTCPYSWQPTDLFLGAIDQSTVDNTMEKFLEEINNICSPKAWLVGHFHAERFLSPTCYMLYRSIVPFFDNELIKES